jgi:hypothetical protein
VGFRFVDEWRGLLIAVIVGALLGVLWLFVR